MFASSGVGWADPPSDTTGNGQRAGGMASNVINRTRMHSSRMRTGRSLTVPH